MKKDKSPKAIKLFELCQSTVFKLVKLGNSEETATDTVCGMMEICGKNVNDYEYVKLIMDQLVEVETQIMESIKKEGYEL